MIYGQFLGTRDRCNYIMLHINKHNEPFGRQWDHGYLFIGLISVGGWGYREMLIRDFPDHATFREKGAKLACADKLGVFLSLTLCKKANFEYLSFIK